MSNLTTEDKQYIIESLLFASCLEIIDNWTEDDRLKMLDIVKKIKAEDIIPKNISLHLFEENHDSSIIKEVISLYPNINTLKPTV